MSKKRLRKVSIKMYVWVGLVALFYWANADYLAYNIQNYPFPATASYRDDQKSRERFVISSPRGIYQSGVTYWGARMMGNTEETILRLTGIYHQKHLYQILLFATIETRASREQYALTKDNKMGDTKLFGMQISHVERNALTEITFDLMFPMVLATLLYFFCYVIYIKTKKKKQRGLE